MQLLSGIIATNGAIQNSQFTEHNQHYDKKAVAKAATEIKERFVQDGYKGKIEGYYKGTGVNVDPSWGIERQLQEANLNWETKTSPVHYGDRAQHSDFEKHAIYNGTTNKLYGVAGKRWEPYQNDQVLGSFNDFCKQASIEIERIGSLEDGGLVFCSAVINQSWKVMSQKDVIAGRLVLSNSHEPGRGLRAQLIAVRLVCCNGTTKNVTMGEQTLSHNSVFSDDKVQEILKASQNNFVKLGVLFDELAGVELTNREARNFLVETLGDTNKEFDKQPRIVQSAFQMFANRTAVGGEMETSDGTAWGLYNTVTQYTNHTRVGAAHISSLWNGGKAQTNTKVLTAMERAFLSSRNKEAQTVGVGAF